MRYSRYEPVTLGYYGAVPPGVKWLLISNTVLFVLYFLAVRAGLGSWFVPFSLIPRAVLSGWGLYQLVTYMFLHSPWGFGHILFNMLALWMFGCDLERSWGTRRFLRYYFLCGIGAGICAVIGNWLYGTLDTRTIGASGAIYGVLLAFGMLFPDATVLFSFLFPIKAKYFVLIIGAIAFLSSLGATGSGVSHVAHLGGMVFGLLYLKSQYRRWSLTEWARLRYSRWKLARARRRFQLYMRKQSGSHHNPWVN